MAPKRARISTGGSSRQPQGAEEPPTWGNKPLSSLPFEWQPRLYQEKMRAMKNVGDTFIAERHVNLEDFRGYGLVEGIERLGWLGALTINADGNSLVYPDETIQWMSTLQREDGTQPPWTITLTGMVNGAVVRLSSATVREIMEVDTLPRQEYEAVSTSFVRSEIVRPEDYDAMIDAIFDAPAHILGDQSPLHVRYLKPLPRLLYKILTWNIVPRLSDKAKVRTADLRPMFAILTGRVRFPFFQLLVANIWESRENSKKLVIPHCRLITEMLKNQGAITRNSRSVPISPTPFDRAHLNKPDFRFKETMTHYVLRDDVTKRVQQFLKPEEAEPEVEIGDDEDEEQGEFEHYGRHEGIRSYPNKPVGYENWSPYERLMYDNQEAHREQQQQWYEQTRNQLTAMEQNMDVMAYYQQKYQHDLFDYSEQARHHHDYLQGLPYQPTPQPRDYSTMEPYDAQNATQPPISYPGMARPEWWGRHQQRQNADRASSSSQQPDAPDPFDMRPLAQGLFEDFFGQRYPH